MDPAHAVVAGATALDHLLRPRGCRARSRRIVLFAPGPWRCDVAPVRRIFVILFVTGLAACGGGVRSTDVRGSDDGGVGPLAVAQDGDGGTSAPSRCTATPEQVTCTHATVAIQTQAGGRDVHFEVPYGVTPAGGWPVVLYFQGTGVPARRAFSAAVGDPYGQYDLSLTVKALLDSGYAVVAPDALGGGTTYWQTNVSPWSEYWTQSADHELMTALLDALATGAFGELNAARLHAMGISSGGFMTSRMAVSYSGKFRSLAIVAASYATCSSGCVVPTPLPQDHPPTLFLHGVKDPIVPIQTMYPYRDALIAEGHAAKSVVDAEAGHAWIAGGDEEIPAWFAQHR